MKLETKNLRMQDEKKKENKYKCHTNQDGAGENVQNGDHSEAHLSTFSQSSKEFQDVSTDGSPKKDKKKKKGLRTPSFLKKKKEKKKVEA
ncbi:gamma-adducin-like isoform X1 [Eurosta solidaginis]|uniref:gamma-adducin-like isoform X1 n=1 Tax=Eurosta solidaginis TaxID=178769 RepID=UPI0035315C90